MKTVRVALAVVVFTLITAFFLDFADILPLSFHILEHFQFFPALLGSAGILAFLLILTLLFGRIYCSLLCPMGILQDIFNRISQFGGKKKKFKFHFIKEQPILRWLIVGVSVLAFVFGFNFFIGFIDPYSAYGRIVTHLFKPVYLAGNNLLETIFTSFGNYTFFKVGIYIASVFTFVVALVTLLAVSILSLINGRIYCNTICPVGTVLGFISRFSIFKLKIDLEKCNSCSTCGKKCKASCIDTKNHQIDYSRCVTCFNCIGTCNKKAIGFKFSKFQKLGKSENKIDKSKRQFLLAAGLTTLAGGKLLAQKTLPVLTEKPKRTVPIMPAGAGNTEDFQRKCTACHLCVSKCPSHVLKPAFMEYGLGGMMQPMLDFKHGFCNYDCTVCGEVCPNHAISHLTQEEKHATQMGQVQFIKENCIVFRAETFCGACSEHCPTQAVAMVTYKDGLTIPQIDTSICVGCGGCEFICPTKYPDKAIYIQGLTAQQKITLQKEDIKEVEIDDFGF